MLTAITVVLAVDDSADEHLQTVEGINGEVRSWLSGLGAEVRALVVGTLPPNASLSPQDLAKHQYRFMGTMQASQQAQKGVLAAWLDQRPDVEQ
jgi:hypothetical protein